RTVAGHLSLSRLAQHFRARDRGDIIGLHTADKDNASKGGALDIDYHGATSTAPDVNLRAAMHWYGATAHLGFRPLLLDSNGKGGFHLRLLLAEAVPAERVFHFLRSLTRDHGMLGFEKPPEQFPKQADVRRCAKGLGNWLRVPGRHHKRDFWSRVWSGDRWLGGHDAIDFLVALEGDPPALLPAIPAPAPPPRARHFRYPTGQGDNLSDRITAYMRLLPNAGEGGGRDDIAFRFAAFLVRDLALADDAALNWLCLWDEGNRPPKGRECLAEILRNARQYGQRPVGCGVATDRPSHRMHPVHHVRFTVEV
ncbi:MAG TPA: hypothetical protein VFW33_03210, partial [Gemmataceae bacterium]|nr:hypothetical protein [Gemmataceae bacterium]